MRNVVVPPARPSMTSMAGPRCDNPDVSRRFEPRQLRSRFPRVGFADRYKSSLRLHEKNGMIAHGEGGQWRSQHDCLTFWRGERRGRARSGSAARPSSPPSWSTASTSARPRSCCGWRRSSTFSSPRPSGMFFPLLVLDAAQASHETAPGRDVGLHAGARHRHRPVLPECARPRLRLSHARLVFRRLLFGQHHSRRNRAGSRSSPA